MRELSEFLPTPHDNTIQFCSEFLRGAGLNLWILFLAPRILLKANLLHGADSRLPKPIEAFPSSAELCPIVPDSPKAHDPEKS
jgi:hypothetical protein